MTKEQLKATLENVFKVARFVADLTKNPTDNAVIAVVESVAMQDWALDLILKLVNGDITPKNVQDCCAPLS